MSQTAAVVPATNPGRLTWEQVKALVLDSVASPHSKRAYARAIGEFARWAGEQQMAGQGSPFGKALLRCRAVLEENGLLDPDVVSAIGRVKGAVQKGRRIGRWLTREEARYVTKFG